MCYCSFTYDIFGLDHFLLLEDLSVLTMCKRFFFGMHNMSSNAFKNPERETNIVLHILKTSYNLKISLTKQNLFIVNHNS